MKKYFNLMLAATLVCGAGAFTACTTDIADNPSGDSTSPTIPSEPTTDQLEVMVTADLPMAVLSNFAENSMGGALVKRVSKTTSDIEDNTKFVLFKGNDITSVFEKVGDDRLLHRHRLYKT